MASVKTPIGNAPVIPLIILMSGMYLAWFGIHYWRSDVKFPSTPVKDILQGNGVTPGSTQPSVRASLVADVTSASSSSASSSGSSGSSSSGSTAGGATGSAIADDALKYKGAGYVYGGNASSPGNWDCSSFVSYVLGHDLGMPLPGGKWGDAGFPPHSHGPTTLQYLMFGQPLNLSQVKAGDLVVSTEHIGIAISPTQMISAQDEALGTGIGGFPGGFPAGPPHYRRVSA